MDVAIDTGIVEKRGSWFSIDGEQLGQGREQTKEYIGQNVELQNKILNLIKDQHTATEEVTSGQKPTCQT